MAVRSPQETSAINRMLKTRGLEPKDLPGMVAAMGYLIQDHEEMRSILARVEPEERQNAYNCLSANMRFPALALSTYMARTAEKAANEKLPTLNPDGSYKFEPALTPDLTSGEVGVSIRADSLEARDICGAQFGVDEAFAKHKLLVTCRSCTKQQVFIGDTRTDAVCNARLEGWVHYQREDGTSQEICPACPAVRRKYD